MWVLIFQQKLKYKERVRNMQHKSTCDKKVDSNTVKIKVIEC